MAYKSDVDGSLITEVAGSNGTKFIESLQTDDRILRIESVLANVSPDNKLPVLLKESEIPLVLDESRCKPARKQGIWRPQGMSRFVVVDLDSFESFRASHVIISKA